MSEAIAICNPLNRIDSTLKYPRLLLSWPRPLSHKLVTDSSTRLARTKCHFTSALVAAITSSGQKVVGIHQPPTAALSGITRQLWVWNHHAHVGSLRDYAVIHFPPRFCSRNSTFFFTAPDHQLKTRLELSLWVRIPTGSYLSMLSGRWVRGREKVL